MSMVGFPLLLIPLAVYNIIVFLMPGVPLSAPIFTVPLMAGVAWPVSLSDMLLALGIVLLLCEVIKGARPGAKYLTDHLLSLVVFGGAAAEFWLQPQRFGNSTFFLLALLSMADFFSGIALRSRRAAGVAAPTSLPVAREVEPVEPAATEPRFDPAPVPAPAPAPPPISVVEPVAPVPVPPPVRTEPPVAKQEVVPEPSHEISSPEVSSPGLQPGHDTPPAPGTPPR
jgi:outer membrane biosynthesis protein TonB